MSATPSSEKKSGRRKNKARGEFVWVQDGVGCTGQYPAQLVIPMKEMNFQDLESDDGIEVQFTTSGRFEWVLHGSIEYPKDVTDDKKGKDDTSTTPSKRSSRLSSSQKQTVEEDNAKSTTIVPKKTPPKRSIPTPTEDGDKKMKPIVGKKNSNERETVCAKEPPAKRQKKNGDDFSLFNSLVAPLVSAGKTVATEVTGFYNNLFGKSAD